MTPDQAQNLLVILGRVEHHKGVVETPGEAIAFAEAVTTLREIAEQEDTPATG